MVEHGGLARMRRGPGGGLVVAARRRSAVATAIGIWFSFVGVTIDEILEAGVPPEMPRTFAGTTSPIR